MAVSPRKRRPSDRRVKYMVGEISGFYGALGVQVEWDPAVGLVVNDIAVPADEIDWSARVDDVLDALAETACPGLIERRARERLHFSRHDLTITTTSQGVVVAHGDAAIALIRATHAKVVRFEEPIKGNFLREGREWTELRRRVDVRLPRPRRSTRSVTPEPRRPDRIVVSFPEALAEPLRSAAMDASRRIRLERNSAYGHPVEVHLPTRDAIRFEPLSSEAGPLECPFEYHVAPRRFHMALRLKRRTDPLSLAVYDSANDAIIGRAWALALMAYADLTCLPQDDAAQSEERDHPGRGPRNEDPWETSLPARQESAGRIWLPATLEPTQETREHLASYVIGHIRRLPPGHRAGAEALAAARKVGIRLPGGTTWVQPHLRGAPRDTVLVFRWMPEIGLVARGKA